jgi:plastocyanin
MTRRHLGTLAVFAALALGACGGGSSNAQPTKTATGGAITVGASDNFRFDVGEIKATPGPLTVTLVNHGAVEHTFAIQHTSLLLKANGGSSATGTVTLAAGTYTFECTVPGHAAAGMKGTIVVA